MPGSSLPSSGSCEADHWAIMPSAKETNKKLTKPPQSRAEALWGWPDSPQSLLHPSRLARHLSHLIAVGVALGDHLPLQVDRGIGKDDDPILHIVSRD